MEISLKFWIESNGRTVMGRGGYEILRAIDEFKSISRASKALGMSYRFVWDYVKRIEEVLGDEIVKSERGGTGGGKTTLTPTGKSLIELYSSFEKTLKSALNGVKGRVERVDGNKVLISVDACEFKEGEEVMIFKNGKIPKVNFK